MEGTTKISVQIDSEGYFTGNYAVVGSVKDGIDIESIPDESDNAKIKCYKLVDGVWVFDDEKYQTYIATQEQQTQIAEKKARIRELKNQLAETDYKVTKCMEYTLTNQELPYDIDKLHAERQAIRDEINTLEEELA